jgi:D-alanyl-D-alanine carboxypeptidase/D-alanyl-D-alanine-endopeptidase (penicillin-binding protein 4)
MRVDVVASPVRYRRTPLFLLLALAILPALGLLVLQRWLDSEADQYDDTRAAVEALSIGTEDQPPVTRRELERAERAALLGTPVLDYRRVPDGVARSASANRLEAELANVLPFVGDTSCAAISVDGVPVGSVNENMSVVPASTVKLMTAAVALEVLGPDYTYDTTVRIPQVEDGVIDGDIYLVGGGDPLLTSDDYPIEDDSFPAFSTTSLDVLADALVEAGVERIRGTVIGDGTRYDDEFVVDSWGEGVAFDEAGPYDALLVNDARVRGRRGVQDNPNAGAAREFQRLLGNRGIRVDNGWGSGEASTLTTVVGTVTSQPLSEVVREMLTNSDNNTAEMLLKELGFVGSGEGSRFAGLVVVDSVLRGWGIPLDGVRLLDGSGLSPANEITCAALLAVLQRSQGTSLATGLPIAGQSGTLRDEFVDTEVTGRLFAKTGTLGNPPSDEPPLAAKALAGYVSGGNGSTIEFALIINAEEVPDDSYQLFWALFAERFATFPDGPESADLTPR